MKKYFLIAAAAGLVLFTSCDRKAETIQEEDVTSQQVLEGNQTPEQYQGSTGVEDDNNNMVANENIALEKQDFKGSFGSIKTQTYTFTVLEPQDYTFSLESGNPQVKYVVSQKDGQVILEASSETRTTTLQPGEYTVVGTMETEDGQPADPNTEFTVHIE